MKNITLLFLLALCIQSSFAQSVGTTEGVFDVSDLGGANYSIPIKVPDGINGMQPSLSLTYSSQGGNGPFGTGWSISGISVISRTGTTIYHDNKVNGISLNGNDRFTLDGGRLILTSGTYGAPNSVYSTELESFKTITANNNLGSGPQSFKVTDQNGWTYEYGNTVDSRQIPVGKTEAVAWYLNKVKDLNGNYMTYTYLNSNGEIILSSIQYNCNENTGLTYQNYVSFSVTSGANPNKVYTAGGSIQNSWKITKVTVGQKTGATWKYYRTYTPEYTNDFYTHLTKITEKGAEELEALKPTEFTYGIVAAACSSNTVSGTQFDNNYNFSSGDYNGDGYTDLVKFSTENQGPYSLLINNKNNGFTQVWGSTFENGFTNSKGIDLTKEGQRTGVINFDYNGDGKSDFARYQNNKSAIINASCLNTAPIDYGNWKRYWVYVSSGTSLNTVGAIVRPGAVNNTNNPDDPYKFLCTTPLTGDFDGDGKSEILLLDNHQYGNGCYYTYLNFLIGERYCTPSATISNAFEPKQLGNVGFDLHLDLTPANSTSHSQTYVIDYNGDGKNEILRVVNGTATTWELNVTFDTNGNPVIGNPVFVQVNSSGYPSAWHQIFTGDFNGDRITDLLTYFEGVGWEIGYGKGNAQFDLKTGPNLVNSPIYTVNNDSIRPVLIADYNGDGKDDIFNSKYDANNLGSSAIATIFYSIGNNSFSNESMLPPTGASLWNKFALFYWPGDFNGDGNVDFIWKDGNNGTLYNPKFHSNETRHLLSKIKNGFGSETKISYLPLTNSGVYNNQTIAAYNYPYIKRVIPFKVVSNVNNDNGINTIGNNTSYTYRGLRFHLQGKGLLGFENVRIYDIVTRMVSEKNFEYNSTYAFPFLKSTYRKYLWPNNITEEVLNSQIFDYAFYYYGSKRIFPYQTGSQQNNTLTSEVVTTTNNYIFQGSGLIPYGITYSNHIGKPFSITINKGNGLEISTQTFSYPRYANGIGSNSANVPVWIYSRPSKVITTNTRQGQPAYSRSATFDYDNATGQLSQTVSDLGTSGEVYNTFFYDSYGNPKTKYTFGNSVLLKQQEIQYDASNRYITKSYFVSDPAIQTNSTYDALTGNKLTETAPDGFINTFTYDAFGRIKTEADNNGGLLTTLYGWGATPQGTITPNVDGAVYYTKVSSNTGSITATKFDRLGRSLSTSANNFENSWIFTKKWYNALGQLVGSTKPAFYYETPQSIINSYDVYGRAIQISAPEGNTLYNYSTAASNYYSISITNPAGQTTSSRTDASGAKISTTDAANNILGYTYHSNGNVRSITNGATILQTYTYDAYNNLTERWDPNYGSYKYTYDAYGQMLTQIDPKNQIYSYKYDGLGRMYKKSSPEGDYLYNYASSAGTNCGKMTSVDGPEGRITYSYGLGNKVNSVSYNDNGLASGLTGVPHYGNYSYSYSYDNTGLLTGRFYSSGSGFLYTYGLNGEQTTVTDINNGTVFYDKQSENAAGQTTNYSQKSGFNNYPLVTEITYDAYNLIARQKTTSANTGVVKNMSYVFAPTTNNLVNRKDDKYGLQENFSYDNLNSLTGIVNTNNAALNVGVQYSTNGNITKKDDAGDFTYNQANKLTEIINFQNIPHATQELEYTSFDKVKTIDEGNYHTEFHYWPDGSRSMMITTNTLTGLREYKMYAPDMEYKYNPSIGKEDLYAYVEGPDGHIVGWQSTDQVGFTDHFVLTDYLGSFTQVVDGWGNVEEEKSYDAWGRLRNPQNWQPYASNIDAGQPEQQFDRGYTGHEYLPYYGIINMNGRLYDPVMGRMFSADPYVNEGQGLQGYNRYTYAYNNPLLYSDPDGNYAGVDDVIALAIGGIANVVGNWGNINSFGQGVTYFGIGALSGEATLYGGPVAGGLVLGFGNSVAQQGFNNGFNKINWGSVALNTLISGVTSFAGARLGSTISPYISSLTGKIASPVIRNAIENAAGGTFVGFTLGGSSSLLTGGENPFLDAIKGGATGFALGFATGTIQGVKVARHMNRSLWTGRPNDPGIAQLEMAPIQPLSIDNSEMFSTKAPLQVTPGITSLEGQHINDLKQVQPWKAAYDKYGRIIERTDRNAPNLRYNIESTHHHIYYYYPKTQMGTIDHIPGPGPKTK